MDYLGEKGPTSILTAQVDISLLIEEFLQNKRAENNLLLKEIAELKELKGIE